MSDEIMRLSPSIAKILLNQSPLHAWHAHRLGGNAIDEPTDAQTRGRIMDKLLFGVGPKICKVAYPNYQTKDAKSIRDEAILQGMMPVIADKLESMEYTALRWKENLLKIGIDLTGESQSRIIWESRGCPCKGIMDHLIFKDGEAIIYDLKSCDDGSDNAVARLIANYGHDIQAAAYVEGVQAVYPEYTGRTRMVFLFAENDPPYAINTVQLAGTYRQLGQWQWEKATRIWSKCLNEDHWPGYSAIPTPIEASPWQLKNAFPEGLPDGSDL